MGFSNVKGITPCILESLDYVHGLPVSMGIDRVSDVSARAGEEVCRMVNGTDLTSGPIEKPGACGGGGCVGAETHINNELVEVVSFRKVTGFGKEVLD